MKHPHFLTILLTAFSLTIGSFAITKSGYTAENLDLAGESVHQIASVTIHEIINPEVSRSEKIRRLEVLFTTRFDMEAISRFVWGVIGEEHHRKNRKGSSMPFGALIFIHGLTDFRAMTARSSWLVE